MELQKLAIEGLWLARSPVHPDERGAFREWLSAKDVEQVIERKFEVAQANVSVSGRGVIRGIHYSLAKSGQAKWVTCVAGSIWDVVVDLRSSSPTFKKWIGLTLNSSSGDALFISEGLGHGFMSLDENSVVTYLLTTPYSPEEEFEINPMDKELDIKWPENVWKMSAKDSSAPTVDERLREGKLPR